MKDEKELLNNEEFIEQKIEQKKEVKDDDFGKRDYSSDIERLQKEVDRLKWKLRRNLQRYRGL